MRSLIIVSLLLSTPSFADSFQSSDAEPPSIQKSMNDMGVSSSYAPASQGQAQTVQSAMQMEKSSQTAAPTLTKAPVDTQTVVKPDSYQKYISESK